MASQFVFIDARVSDVDTLLGGLVPGAQVHLLDPARDGLAQIAGALREAGASGLSAVSIVAHGAPGRLEIGPDGLTHSGLQAGADALRMLGAALAAGGTLRLYACDLARGETGHMFVAALSRALGDAVIAAAHPVGSARLGASWDLHPVAGPVDGVHPFTLEARNAYRGTLAVKFEKPSDPIGDTGDFDQRMVFGDFDSDGDVDILYQSGNVAGTGIGYKQNNGSGGFTDFSNASGANTPFTGFDFSGRQIVKSTMSVVDINNDGRVDIVDRTAGSQQYWQQGSNGTFTKVTDPIGDTGDFDQRMVFGDFDSDGDVDILYQNGNVAGTGFGYKQNNGSGGFTDFSNASGANTPFTGFDFSGRQINSQTINLFVVDINNDGRVDIVDRTAGSQQYWQQGSNGIFTKVTDPIGDTGDFDQRMVFGDFDSDGDVDILYQSGNVAGTGFGYKQNNGSGGFTDFSNASGANTPFTGFDFSGRQIVNSALFVVDLDKDGDFDIVDRSAGSQQYWRQDSDNAAADGSPPTLASSSPSDNATGVSPNANITLTFDESVTKGTGNLYIVRTSDNAVIETIAVGSAQVTGSGTTWTINPNTMLAGLTGYAVRADSGIFKDADGAVFFGIGNNTTLNFTTGVANTAPSLSANAGSTVAEGGTDTVTSGELAFTDAEQGPGAVTYTVTSAVTNGTLFKSGNALGLGGTFTQADINANLITYTHNGSETTSASFGFVVSDGAGGSTPGSFTFNVTPVNDAPTFSATGATATFIEGSGSSTGAPVALFSNAAVSTVETGQTVQGFTVAVHGLLDGADEALVIDGATIALVDLNSGTTGNGLTYTVGVAFGSATMTFTGGALSAAAAAGIVNSIAYVNLDADDPTAGTRTVVVSNVRDSGGIANGGADTATGFADATVTVAPVDDAPEATDLPVAVTQRIAETGNVITDAPVDDPDSAPTLTRIAFGNTSQAIVAGTDTVIAGTYGTLTIGADGSYSYLAGESQITVGDTATDTFVYTTFDGTTPDSAGLTFTVTGSATGNADSNTFLLTGSGKVATGGDGNDTYTVDAGDDRVIEAANGGNDTVIALSSYTLEAGQEIENLMLAAATGAAAFDLTGNAFAQTLTGNDGANVLDGGAGADRMVGGLGDDTFMVDDANDLLYEGDAAGSGIDTVLSSVTYKLRANIETLELTGPGNLNGTGNDTDNTITGTLGANTLDGRGGADTLIGGDGNDRYVVDDAGDTVTEEAGTGTGFDTILSSVSFSLTDADNVERLQLTGIDAIDATGTSGNDVLVGNGSGNRIAGGLGLDKLTGGLGGDTFVFDTAPGPANVDTITDFEDGVDTILLENAIFTALGEAGALGQDAFAEIGRRSATVDEDARILYDTVTGILYYDANGGDAGDRQAFALLRNKAPLDFQDFEVA